MKQKMTTKEKLACIEEIKKNILNACEDSFDELDKALEDVVGKLLKKGKLSEMTSKKNIEETFVTYLAMSLAGRKFNQNGALDLVEILSSKNIKSETDNPIP